MSVSVSCGLLQFGVSQSSVELLRRTVEPFVEALAATARESSLEVGDAHLTEGGDAHLTEGGNAHSTEGGNAHLTEGGIAHSTDKGNAHLIKGIDGRPSARNSGKAATAAQNVPEAKALRFSDDLRTGDFKYITESEGACEQPGGRGGWGIHVQDLHTDLHSGAHDSSLPPFLPPSLPPSPSPPAGPGIPRPGEILFQMGDRENSPGMAWCYREPRAVTHLLLLPVPFSITTEGDAPTDIKVRRELQQWHTSQSTLSLCRHVQSHPV